MFGNCLFSFFGGSKIYLKVLETKEDNGLKELGINQFGSRNLEHRSWMTTSKTKRIAQKLIPELKAQVAVGIIRGKKEIPDQLNSLVEECRALHERGIVQHTHREGNQQALANLGIQYKDNLFLG